MWKRFIAFYRCPPGYHIEKLEPHHSELVHSKRTIPGASRLWTRQYIENLNSLALYHSEASLTQPIAWVLEYPSRELGSSYTFEGYRRKGFGSLLLATLANCLHKDNYEIPILGTVEKGNVNYILLKQLGAIESGYVACSI